MITDTRRVTARGLLFGPDPDGVESLARALERRGVSDSLRDSVGALGTAGHRALLKEVARAGDGLLQIEPAALIVNGWRKHSALIKAARASIENPGSTELVDLATHRITSIHCPYVELLVDGTPVAKVSFELKLVLLLRALVAGVRGGRLTTLHSGVCEVTAQLSANGIPLVHRSGELDLHLAVAIGEGIVLVSPPQQSPAPGMASSRSTGKLHPDLYTRGA